MNELSPRPVRPFVVLSLPRSRSRWLATYLSSPTRPCGHDLLTGCSTFEDFLRFFHTRRVHGSCETAGMLGWKLLRKHLPNARIVLIRRSAEAVKASLRQCGWTGAEEEVDQRDALLDAIAGLPRVVSYDYSELYDAEVCRRLFEYCVGEEWDPVRWQTLAGQNIQIDIGQRMTYLAANWQRLAMMKAQVLREAQGLGGMGLS